MKIINFFANKLPDYTYSIPGLLLYFFDPGHTGWGFRFRERFFFHSNDLLVDMKGKSCLIAGGNAGIGRAAANGLAKMGATVHIISRNKDKGSSAVQEIKDSTGNTDIHLHVVDLSSKQQINRFTEGFVKSGQKVHVLINNAATMCGERTVTSEGFESALATNLIGFVCLTKGLLPALEAANDSSPARIINVVSAGMLAMKFKIKALKDEDTSVPYDGAAAYSLHHRARVMLTELWAEELKEDGVVVNSVHPGWVNTPLLASAAPMQGFYKMMQKYLRTEAEGADTIIWLASSKGGGEVSGRYFFDRKARWTNLPFANTEPDKKDYQALVDFVEKAM